MSLGASLFPCSGSCRKPLEQARFGNPIFGEQETSTGDGVEASSCSKWVLGWASWASPPRVSS